MSTSQTTGIAGFPSESELDAVTEGLARGAGKVEAVKMRLAKIERGGDNAPVATLADVGALYSFVAYMKLEAETLAGWAAELDELLGWIDGRRCEARA